MSAINVDTKEEYLVNRPRIRISDLKVAKERGERWAMLTSYDATSASIFDHAGLPCLLVGDSAAQAVYGYKSTLPVTMDELIPLARAVVSSCQRALVIADMPFGSYQESPQQALKNATRFMKESQVHGVKLEGGADYEAHVALLTKSGIPVMAHVGFTPQSEHTIGGYKVQGRGSGRDKVLHDALVLEKAGAFACVLELVPGQLAGTITHELRIPTVGIGAGPLCDAQILVWNDMVGFSAPKQDSKQRKVGGGSVSYLTDCNGNNEQSINEKDGEQKATDFELIRAPKFVKRYANVSEIIHKAVLEYVNDVKNGTYPASEHSYD